MGRMTRQSVQIYMCMAKLEMLLKEKCKTDINLKWPCVFKKFIDDGFGIMEGNKLDIEYWVLEFHLLHDSITIDKFKVGNTVDFMDLYMYINIYIYIYI